MSRGSKILELRRQTWRKRATPTSTAFVQASERVRATAEPNRAGDRPVVPGRLLLNFSELLRLKLRSRIEISFFYWMWRRKGDSETGSGSGVGVGGINLTGVTVQYER